MVGLMALYYFKSVGKKKSIKGTNETLETTIESSAVND